MADYKRMYQTLCAGVSAVLDEMPPEGPFAAYHKKLEALLLEAEDIYIDTENLVPLDPAKR